MDVPPGDPEVQAQGAMMSGLLLQLLYQIPGGIARQVIAQWKWLPMEAKTCVDAKSYVDAKSWVHAKRCVDALVKIYKEITVLWEAKAIDPQLQTNLVTEISQNLAHRRDWQASFLRCIGGGEKIERKLKLEVEIKQKEIKVLRSKIQELEWKITSTQKHLLKSINVMKENSRVLKSTFWENEIAIKRKLKEKDMLMELTRMKDQADKLQIKEAHKLECDELRLKAEKAEAFSKEVVLKRFQTAVEDTLSKSIQVEKDHSGTTLRSLTPLENEVLRQRSQKAVEVALSKSIRVVMDHSGTRLRSAESTSCGAGGESDDMIFSVKLEPETESQDKEDLETETILQRAQAAIKRARDSGQYVSPNVAPKPQGDEETASVRNERKKTRVT